MKNAVLPEDSSGMIDLKLSKIFESAMTATEETENPLTLDYIKENLTKDDLVFALQATIWSITNPEAKLTYQGTTDGKHYNALIGNDGSTNNYGKQGRFIYIIKQYYEENYMSNKNIVAAKTDELCIPKITTPDKKLVFTDDDTGYETSEGEEIGKSDLEAGYIFVGPFKIEPSEEGKQTVDYSIDISFKDINGNRISSDNIVFYLKSGAATDADGLYSTKESLEGKEFYVVLKKEQQ